MSYTYKYPRPAVTADCVVITHEAEPRVLLIKRGGEPFKDCWAIPGGFMEMNETTEQCAVRELKEETGLNIKLIKDEPLITLKTEKGNQYFSLINKVSTVLQALGY